MMTKHPMYGSLTGWHRDFRYWAFERADLVSVWLAVGTETNTNGALWLVPGSHTAEFGAEAFDEAKFFRGDLPANRALIDRAVCPEPEAPATWCSFPLATRLHSAGQNRSDQVKFSLVYTYHAESNRPLPGSRSASKARRSALRREPATGAMRKRAADPGSVARFSFRRATGAYLSSLSACRPASPGRSARPASPPVPPAISMDRLGGGRGR